MKQKAVRRTLACLLSALTLWGVIATTGSDSPGAALGAIREAGLSRQIVRWELGDFFPADHLPFSTLLALRQSPLLMAGRDAVSRLSASAPSADGDEPPAEATPTIPPSTVSADLEFLDNGAPAETVIPSSKKGYSVVGNVYIKNTSTQSPDLDALAKGDFAAKLSELGPQVLIIHTHGSEAYTMPAGQEYTSSGSYRTADARCSVIRVGDEMAATLSRYGISVLHDRNLYDAPEYNGAYYRSMDAIEDYLAKYPSLVFVLDVHRDAIEDSSGRQYKVVSKEDPHAAQISLIMGSDYTDWMENLKLAVAVQQTITQAHPTLMRPLALRNSGYNEEATVGSLLVEVGAAGNSLDEAIYAGRLFAEGLAETIQKDK